MNKKIIEINKLQEKLIPKRGKIALAHGVFDLFHIGHLKHLREAKKFGTLIVLDYKKRLKGTYSDGDSRRDAGKDFQKLKVKDLMTKKPITIEKNVLAVKCLRLMQNNNITKVIVAKKDRIEGLISIHHIIASGIR